MFMGTSFFRKYTLLFKYVMERKWSKLHSAVR